ncbi:MAG: FRG domain-containing protein [Acidobacteriia bacterium]|nr:FRG domain-containing protein [Terriglobia bacterium]
MAISLLRQLPKKIQDWATLAAAQDLFRWAEEKEEWVFRGVSDGGGNELRTTLEVVASEFDVTGDKIPDLEVKLILEFMRRYHLYGLEPPPQKGDTLDWLALMRHHGAPSRFLDFTFSFLVAAYFALERKPTATPVIWAINKSWLTREIDKMMDNLGEPIAFQFKRYERFRDGNAFREVFFKARPCLVGTTSPFRLNERLTIQQGLFLCPGDVTKTFDENLRAMPNQNKNVLKIPIVANARPTLLAALHRANLTRATLFPGLDGFAMSLWTRALFLKRLQSMEDSRSRSSVNLDIDALGEW